MEGPGINREYYKMNLKEIWQQGVDCIHVANSRDK